MATDLEEEEEIAAWKETLNDGLDELEEVEEPEVEDIGLDTMIETIEDQLRPKEEAIENLTETLTETAEDEDLLAKALREKAKVEMDDYLKSREDDQEVAN
jgi:hypothetical protein